MTVQDTQPAGAEDTFKQALDNRLNAIGWGLSLVMLGGLWLAPKGMIPEGAWLIGTGLIILGLSVVRYLNDIKVSWFWIGLGVLALGTAVGEIVGLSLPVFPILLIIAGVATLFRIFFVKERHER
jgi:hypothetical protein